MKIIIVPSHNQSKHIEKIIRSYEKQTVNPDLLLFVFDRCVDDSLEVIKNIKSELNVEYIIKDFGENFSAGMTRDFGVDYIQKNYPEYEMIIFTDGDCIASEKLVEKHHENCSQLNSPIVSCGKRIKETVGGIWEDDERLDSRWVNEFTFTERNSRMIVSNALCLENILTYSCNFAFNKSAIEKCQEINEKLSKSKRVFNLEFDGCWGGEDNFISHSIFRIGGYILLTDLSCFVTHYYHSEEVKNHARKNQILNRLSQKLKELIFIGDVFGPIQYIRKGFYINFGGNDYKNEIKNSVDIYDVNPEMLNFVDYICDNYNLVNKKNIFKYYLTQNAKMIVDEGNVCNVSDYDIVYFKEFLGYLKFYLKNGKIEFVDDVEKFKKIIPNTSFLEYC